MKKLLAILLTVFTFAMAGVFYGCGDPYKKARISVISGESITLNINELGEPETAEVKVRISGMPKKSSTEIVSMDIDKDVAYIVENSLSYKQSSGESTFSVVANKGGTATLTIRADGGKSAKVNIMVQERLRGISFNSTYKPAIVVGQDFIADINGINFNKPTATNQNVSYYLIDRQNNKRYDFEKNVLPAASTRGLKSGTTNSYFLHAVSEDGRYDAQTEIAVVERINVSDIKLYIDNDNFEEIKDNKITLAANVLGQLDKNLIVDVSGKTNLKVELDTSESNLTYIVEQDTTNSARFKISKQNIGIANLKVKVGYANSFDFYSVSKTFQVEVYAEPLEILIKNATTDKQETYLNVFAAEENNEYERINVSIDPDETNNDFKKVEIRIANGDFTRGIFNFYRLTNSGYELLNNKFEDDKEGNGYKVYVFDTLEQLYVAKTAKAKEDDYINVNFVNTRNREVTKELKLVAHAQIQGLKLVGDDVKENTVNNQKFVTIFAPLGYRNIINFKYDDGYSNLKFAYNSAAIAVSDLDESNRDDRIGTFIVEGKRKGESTLTIYNGSDLQFEVTVVVGTPAAFDASIKIEANDSAKIVSKQQQVIDGGTILTALYFNNTQSAGLVRIVAELSYNNVDLYLNAAVKNNSDNEINYNLQTGYVTVANENREANAILTFVGYYYKQTENGGNNYKLVEFNYDVQITYIPKLLENMVGFRRHGTDTEILSETLTDFTTISYSEALSHSILDVDIFVNQLDDNDLFSIANVELELGEAKDYISVKTLHDEQNNKFRFQILAGGLTGVENTQIFDLTFNIYQAGNQKITKVLPITIEKSKKVSSFVIDASGSNLSKDGNDRLIMQLGTDGEAHVVNLKESESATTNLPFELVNVDVQLINENFAPVQNGTLPISVNASNGLVTRIAEGRALVTLSLKNNQELDRTLWLQNSENPFKIVSNNTQEFIVVCYGDNTAKILTKREDLASIGESGTYQLGNNIDLSNFPININTFRGRLDGKNYILFGVNQSQPLFNVNAGVICNLQIMKFNQTVSGSAEYAGLVCNTNVGTIYNVFVGGTVTIKATKNNVNYGVIAGINAATNGVGGVIAGITLSVKFNFNVDANATGKFVVGGICGVNAAQVGAIRLTDNGSNVQISTQSIENVEAVPNVSIKVDGLNDNVYAIIGGAVGQNVNGTIQHVKAEAIVNSQNAAKAIVGGLVGENEINYNAFYNVSGSLTTEGKLASAGSLVGVAKNYTRIENAVAVVKNTAGKTFSATNAGCVVGEAYANVELSNVNVYGRTASADKPTISGDNVGGLFGTVGEVYANNVSINNLNVLSGVGGNEGKVAAIIGATKTLPDVAENYVYNVYYAPNQYVYELTTTNTGNVEALKDSFGRDVFINAGTTQLYFDKNRPVYRYIDGDNNLLNSLKLNGTSVTLMPEDVVYRTTSNGTIINSTPLANATIDYRENGDVVLALNGTEYALTYFGASADGDAVYSYFDGVFTNYIVYDSKVYALYGGEKFYIEINNYRNYVTTNSETINGIAPNTIVTTDVRLQYPNGYNIEYYSETTGEAVRVTSNEFKAQASSFENLTLNNISGAANNWAESNGLAHSVTSTAMASMALAPRVGETLEQTQTNFVARVGSTNAISSLSVEDFKAEILPYSTNADGVYYSNILNVGVSSINSPVIVNLKSLIASFENYNVKVNENSTAKAQIYLNNLIVENAGVVVLELSNYANNASEKQYLFVRIAEMPSLVLTTDSLGRKTIEAGVYISKGSDLEFYVFGNTANMEVSSDKGVVASTVNPVTVKFDAGSNGGRVYVKDFVKFKEEPFFADDTNNKITLPEFKHEVFEKDFEVLFKSNIKGISATIDRAVITKNEQATITVVATVDGKITPAEVFETLTINGKLVANGKVVIENGEAPLIVSVLNVDTTHYYEKENETDVVILLRAFIESPSIEVNSGYSYTITAGLDGVYFANALSLDVVPQYIDTIFAQVQPLLNDHQVETIAPTFVSGKTAIVTIDAYRHFNDMDEISVSLDVIGADKNSISSFGAISYGGVTEANAARQKVAVKKVDGKFVFKALLTLNDNFTDEMLENMRVKLTVNYNANDTQEFEFNIITLPDIQFSFNPYYAVGTAKEIAFANAKGENLDYNSWKDVVAGFTVDGTVSGVTVELPTEQKTSVDIDKNYSLILENKKLYFKSKVDKDLVGDNINLNMFVNVKLNNKNSAIAVSRVNVKVVKYTIDQVTMSTPSGRQQRDKEIPIDFNVYMSYAANAEFALVAKEAEAKFKAQLLKYWTSNSSEKYVKLFYLDSNGQGGQGIEIVKLDDRDTRSYIYKNSSGVADFVLVPSIVNGEISNYTIWGVSLDTWIQISVRTIVEYKGGIPQLLPFNEQNEKKPVSESISKFKFYKLTTEDTPEPIYNNTDFEALGSVGDSTVGTDTDQDERHFRLMNNIYLNNYKPIDANFDSLDGNGYVIYINSFDVDNTDESDGSIALGLFKEIGEGTIVKNLSVAVNGLHTTGLSATGNVNDTNVIDLTNYSQVDFGIITPKNHGYIVNCELVSFDLTAKNADAISALGKNSRIQINTAFGANVNVGGLVAHNYGSVINSRVGRSINSDYEYLGYGLVGGVVENYSSKIVGEVGENTAYSRLIDKEHSRAQNSVSIIASGTIGGLVAHNYENALISSSYFVGDINNTSSVVETSFTGGLAAFNNGNIALSAVEGNFSDEQQQIAIGSNADNSNGTDDENADQKAKLLIRMGSTIRTNGNVGGLVYKNTGEISDSYTNIAISTNARSAAFVYNTEQGTVKNSYAFSSSETTTNNAPFVGLEPFETTYKGDVETSYYYKPSSTASYENVTAEDRINNTDLLTRIPDSSYVLLQSTFTSFAFSALDPDSPDGEEKSLENGVWKFSHDYGPILSSAHAIAVSSYRLKRDTLQDIFDDSNVIDGIGDLGLNGDKPEYVARKTGETNYILIRNARQFNDRILNGEAEYQSKKASGAKQNVYRLIADITFGKDSYNTTIGTSNLQFEGILDGNGLKINNLSITSSTVGGEINLNKPDGLLEVPNNLATGMFAAVANGGCIKNLNVYVKRVALSTASVVGSVVGILENSYVYNVNVLPYVDAGSDDSNVSGDDITDDDNNHVTGGNVVGGVVGMVIGDASKFKIANVTSSVSVSARENAIPIKQKVDPNDSDPDLTLNSIYNGFVEGSNNVKIENVTLDRLLATDSYGNRIFNGKYNGLSIAAGVVGVTDVSAPDSLKRTLANGTGNNVSYAQISRVKAFGSEMRVAAINVGGIIGVIDEYVYLHDAEFEALNYVGEATATTQKLGGTLTAGGIAAVNNGLIKYARLVHANQFELDEVYLSKNQEYNVEQQNSEESLFRLTTISLDGNSYIIPHVYVGGITAINNVGEIADSYVKVNVKPISSGGSDSCYVGFAAGRSIGGRISYFYSLADISKSYYGGLIGYANKNYNIKGANGNTLNAEQLKEFEKEFNFTGTSLETTDVKNVPYIIINTASIIMPVENFATYGKFGALIGQNNDANIFGDQTYDTTFKKAKTTLMNINFTNSVDATNNTLTHLIKDGSDKGMQTAARKDFYMLKGKTSGAEYEKVYDYNFNASNGFVNDFKTLINNRASQTFSAFLLTLRWNVYTTYRMPFPFYGISDALKYINRTSDFLQIADYPDAAFIVGTNNDLENTGENANTYILDNKTLNRINQTEFKGVFMSRNSKTKIVLVGQSGESSTSASLFGSINGAAIYDVTFEVRNIVSGGVFGRQAINAQFENVNVEVNGNVAVSTQGNSINKNAFGFLVGYAQDCVVRICQVKNLKNTTAVATIHTLDGSVGGLVGIASGSTISESSATNVKFNAEAVANNSIIGGVVGTMQGSTVTNSNAANAEIDVKGTSENVTIGGFVGEVSGTSPSTIIYSYATANHNDGEFKLTSNSTGSMAGGFAGSVSNATISYSFADVSVKANNVGGFVGTLANGSINSSYLMGALEGATVGGFIYSLQSGTINNCYTTSEINCSKAGGFAYSVNTGSISNSYTLSKISGSNSTDHSGNFISTGNSNLTVSKCYYASELNYNIDLKNTSEKFNINDEFSLTPSEGIKAKSFSDFFDGNLENKLFESEFSIEKDEKYQYTYMLTLPSDVSLNFANQFNSKQKNNKKLRARIINSDLGTNGINGSDYASDYIYLLDTDGNNAGISLRNTYGNLDGKIVIGKNLSQNGQYHITLSGDITAFGNVTNSIITNVRIMVSGKSTTSLVAKAVSGSILNKIATSGDFTANGTEAAGSGAIAQSLSGNSLLVNSRNEATINATTSNAASCVGGLVGKLEGSAIINSYNGANVNGASILGGLVGTATVSSRIYKSYNIGKVLGNFTSGEYIGGLVGKAPYVSGFRVSIESCYNTGLLVGKNNIAGLVNGEMRVEGDYSTYIENSYNTGAINFNKAAIASGEAEKISPICPFGYNGGSATYFNKDLFPELSNLSNGKTTKDLLRVNVGDDFVVAQNTETIKEYFLPMLKGVGGTSETVFGGQTNGRGANLVPVNNDDNNVYIDTTYNYILTSHIDGDKKAPFDFSFPFTGSIYGCDYTYYNAIHSLIGNAENATVSNVRVMGSAIENPYQAATATLPGDISASVARNFTGGYISNIMFTGDINAVGDNETNYAGGIVGNLANATITNCHAIEVDVYQYFQSPIETVGEYYMGGLVGKSTNSNIINSSFSGNIYVGRQYWDDGSVGFGKADAKFYVGGVAGLANGGYISNNAIQHQAFYSRVRDDGTTGHEIPQTNAEILNVELKNATETTTAAGNGTVTVDGRNIYFADSYNVKSGANISGTGNGIATNKNQSFNLRKKSTDFTNINVGLEIGEWKESLGNNILGKTYSTPQLITSYDEFESMAANGYYRLVCDITRMTGEGENKTVATTFENVNQLTAPKYFDGRGYTVKGFRTISEKADQTDVNAMFGGNMEGKLFKNVLLDKFIVKAAASGGSDVNSAIIIAENKGKIRYVGLVGCVLEVTNGVDNTNYSRALASYTVGNVGAFAGTNTGTISYCYSLAEISVVSAVNGKIGGLVGTNNGTVKDSYCSGIIAIPYDPSEATPTNRSASSGTVANGTAGIRVYGNSQIHATIYKGGDISSDNYYKTSAEFNTIELSQYAQINSTYNSGTGLIKEINAGMPIYQQHKNFTRLNRFAFNWIGNITTSEGVDNLIELTDLEQLREMIGAISQNTKFYLSNNIFCSNSNLSDYQLSMTYGGKIYFNGYSIFNFTMDIDLDRNNPETDRIYFDGCGKLYLYNMGLFATVSGAEFYNPSFINPNFSAKTSRWLATGSSNQDNKLKLSFGLLAGQDIGGASPTKIYDGVALGGILSYEQKTCHDNNPPTVKNKKTADDIYMPDIYVGGLIGDSTNVDLSNTSTLEHETSGMFVKTGDAKSADLEIESVYIQMWVDTIFNGIKKYKDWVNLKDENEGVWDGDNMARDHSDKSIVAGSITLSQVYLNSGNYLVYVQSGAAISGNATHGSFRMNYWSVAEKNRINATGGVIPGSATTGNAIETAVNKTDGFVGKICVRGNDNTAVGSASRQHILWANHAFNPAKKQDGELNVVSGTYEYTGSVTKIRVI